MCRVPKQHLTWYIITVTGSNWDARRQDLCFFNMYRSTWAYSQTLMCWPTIVGENWGLELPNYVVWSWINFPRPHACIYLSLIWRLWTQEDHNYIISIHPEVIVMYACMLETTFASDSRVRSHWNIISKAPSAIHYTDGANQYVLEVCANSPRSKRRNQSVTPECSRRIRGDVFRIYVKPLQSIKSNEWTLPIRCFEPGNRYSFDHLPPIRRACDHVWKGGTS